MQHIRGSRYLKLLVAQEYLYTQVSLATALFSEICIYFHFDRNQIHYQTQSLSRTFTQIPVASHTQATISTYPILLGGIPMTPDQEYLWISQNKVIKSHKSLADLMQTITCTSVHPQITLLLQLLQLQLYCLTQLDNIISHKLPLP